MSEGKFIPDTVYHDAARKVAMASPAHLKKWLRETRRHFVILPADQLVDSLPWPEGVETIVQMIECFRQHRAVQSVEDVDENGAAYNRHLDDRLELHELRELRDFVRDLITEEEQRQADAQKRKALCKGAKRKNP